MRYIKAILFLLPSLSMLCAIAYLGIKDLRLRQILLIEFEAAAAILVALTVVILSVIVWNWTKAGLYLLFKIDLRMKKNDGNP